MNNEQYDLYCNRKLIMQLEYKPSIDDVIKDDDTGIFYKVTRVSKMNKACSAKITVNYL